MIGAATRGLLRPYNKSLTLSLFPFCLAPLSKLLEHERLHSVMCSFQVCMYDKSKRTSISYLWLHVTKLVCVTCENNWVTTQAATMATTSYLWRRAGVKGDNKASSVKFCSKFCGQRV